VAVARNTTVTVNDTMVAQRIIRTVRRRQR
jgi:hypothetical protein